MPNNELQEKKLSFILSSIGTTSNKIDLQGLANKLGITHQSLITEEATIRAVVQSNPCAQGSVLLQGTGSVDFDFHCAAALGVPVLLLIEEEGIHVQLSHDKAQELGTIIAGEITPEELESEKGAEKVASLISSAQGVTQVMSPEIFESWLLNKARSNKKHIVLPEGEDDRILQAADILLQEKICELTILGDEESINQRAKELNLNLDAAHILDPEKDERREEFAQEFAELRKSKGMTIEQAREIMKDISYYATMLVHKGLADGMVSGAAHTTAHTIRPSLQIIKTAPGSSVVSSIFLMVMHGRLWAFGDCAVNPNPTVDQLAEIAMSSAHTAAQFGLDPKVAMLSYSTGESGSGPDVEACVAAIAQVRERAPELAVDGPLQFDAAVDSGVAAKKMPGSSVAGQANVFIFPDLNSGNICYKAVQRTGGALAIGPILQGLNKPVNDLSRGATVADIVNTVAITAIQAGK